MRFFSTSHAALPLLAASLLWACNADVSPSGDDTSDALKGGIPAHGAKAESDDGNQAGKGEDRDDADAAVDEHGDEKKDGHADKPKKHDQDSGVDEDDQGDENDHGDKDHDDKGDESEER